MAGRRLRDLLDNSPGEFVDAVTERLRVPGESPEQRYLVSLLVSRGLLIDVLRQIGRDDAAVAGHLARLAQRLSPGFERSLARAVLDAEHAREPNGEAEFLLGLLGALSAGATVLPLLGPLRHSEDPRVRSRMASLLGRTAGAQRWFTTLKDDPDPRVRANAIEALWTTEGPFAAACFESAVEDPHHRVVASAWVGTYLQGDAAAVAGLATMAQHADPRFCAAAAWAMGETGDTRFIPLLWRLRRDPAASPVVARNALQAIKRITETVTNGAPEPLELRVLRLDREAGGPWRAEVLVRDRRSSEAPALRATDWNLSAGSEPVWSYAMERVEAVRGVSLGILLPASQTKNPAREAALPALLRPCFASRRHHGSRVVAFYSEDPPTQVCEKTGDILRLGEEVAARHDDNAPQILTEPARILGAADARQDVRRLPGGPLRPLEALAGWLGSAPGDRHVVIVLDKLHESAWSEDGLAPAIEAARKRSVTVHLLASWHLPDGQLRRLAQLAAGTGGLVLRVRDHGECSARMTDLVDALACRFRLRFEPPAAEGALRLTLQSRRYRGEVSVEAQGDII